MEVTTKQRSNAEREITSVVCAGCDGPKNRGAMFCRKCGRVLLEEGFPEPACYANVAEAYTERIEFLLSRKGRKARLAVAA
jgi:predicted amidophosphoribosyltransferase